MRIIPSLELVDELKSISIKIHVCNVCKSNLFQCVNYVVAFSLISRLTFSIIEIVSMESRVLTCAAISLLLRIVSGGNILFLSGVPSPSHHIYNRVLALGLAEKGHNVTFLSADNVKEAAANVHYIHLEKVYEAFYQGDESLNVLHYADQSPLEAILDIPSLCTVICEGVLASQGLDAILNYPKDFEFDVVIYDFTFGPCLIPLVTKFNNPPVVSVSAFANPPYTTDIIGGQNYPAYVPYYSLDYPVEMTFVQRTYNLYLYFVDFL